MRIDVRYMTQVKRAAGVAADAVELPAPCTVADLLSCLAERRAEPLRRLLLSNGRPHRSLLVFVGDAQVAVDDPTPLPDGAVVTLLAPMAGG